MAPCSVILTFFVKKSIKCYYVFAMRILGIETSCDETAAAIIEIAEDNSGEQSRTIKVLSNTISSQVKLHAKFGGVVPNLAAREHVKNIGHVFRLALKEAGLSRSGLDNIDLIAVTRGPGLGPALLVGIAFAKALAWKYSKPLIGVNHLEGHILSNFFKKVGAISNFSRFAFANRGSSIAKQSGQFPISKQISSSKKFKIIHTCLDYYALDSSWKRSFSCRERYRLCPSGSWGGVFYSRKGLS